MTASEVRRCTRVDASYPHAAHAGIWSSRNEKQVSQRGRPQARHRKIAGVRG